MLLHLCIRTLLVKKWKKQCTEGSTCFGKRTLLKSLSIEDYVYQTFNIPCLFLSKGDNFQFFTNLINSKLISELVSRD